jgi:hypothetical protein
MQREGLDGTPLLQACCRDALGPPCTGHPDLSGDAYRHRRRHRAPRTQRIGIACGRWGRSRVGPPLRLPPQRGRSQRPPPRRVRPPARSALWHGASCLLPRCARRSRTSPGRPPSRSTRCRSARPHDTPSLCHRPAVHRGDDQAAPHALFDRAARRLDHAGAGRTASPSAVTPSRQLRDTTVNRMIVFIRWVLPHQLAAAYIVCPPLL